MGGAALTPICPWGSDDLSIRLRRRAGLACPLAQICRVRFSGKGYLCLNDDYSVYDNVKICLLFIFLIMGSTKKSIPIKSGGHRVNTPMDRPCGNE